MGKNKEKPIKKISERISNMFDMPTDIVLDTPKVTVMSFNSITIENYTGLLEYTDTLIKVRTKEKIISVTGERLVICVITDNYIMAEGIINYVRWE